MTTVSNKQKIRENFETDGYVLVENVLLLDHRAGELKRKITVPFIKEILSL